MEFHFELGKELPHLLMVEARNCDSFGRVMFGRRAVTVSCLQVFRSNVDCDRTNVLQ